MHCYKLHLGMREMLSSFCPKDTKKEKNAKLFLYISFHEF